ALRLIDAGARLIADDQSELTRDGERIVVRSPATIRGLIEVRGVGIVRLEPLAEAPLALVADLVASEAIERLPKQRVELMLGIAVPLIEVAPFAASAVAKVRLALAAFTGSGLPAIIGQ